MPAKILILAGTNDALLLANKLFAKGYDVTSSFAGVTANPILPKGKIRRGGFGGVDGLRKVLAEEKFDILVDATHPFAAVISRNAAEAHSDVLRLERPAWIAQDGDCWIVVPDIPGAVEALPFEARVMLTIGRKEADAFTSRPDLSGVVRMIEAPDHALPKNWRRILQRPPFTLAGEIELMTLENITHLVTKNAGGAETAEKLAAARSLSIPVVMVARPFKSPVRTFDSVDAIAAYIASR